MQGGQPPLTDHLIEPSEHFREFVPDRLRGLLADLRADMRAGAGSLEELLERHAASATADSAAQMMAMRLYLARVVARAQATVDNFGRDGTAYDRLVFKLRELQSQRGCQLAFVTFNYDTLLDGALERAGMLGPLTEMDHYIRLDEPHLYKLHGSVDWILPARPANRPLTETAKGDAYVIDNAQSLVIEKETRHVRKFRVLLGFLWVISSATTPGRSVARR